METTGSNMSNAPDRAHGAVDRVAQTAHQAVDRIASKAGPAMDRVRNTATSAADSAHRGRRVSGYFLPLTNRNGHRP